MKIKFSDESLSDLRNIEEYLLEHWSDKILDDFLTKLDEIVEIICDFFGDHNLLYLLSDNKKIVAA